MDDEELAEMIEELRNIENEYDRKYEFMARIALLREDDIDIENYFDSMTEDAVKKVKSIIREMKVFDDVLKMLPEGTVKSQLERWLVDESGWYI